MDIAPGYHPVVIVLGKRLHHDQLTPEGLSRVAALCHIQNTLPSLAGCSVIFCGGITQGQLTPEAKRMWQAYQQQNQKVPPCYPATQYFCEDKSTTTVENIRFVSRILVNDIAPTLSEHHHGLQVVFVSNDYHLERVLTIQRLMPKQGLLRLMEQYCDQHQVRLRLSYDVDQHVVTPYPYKGKQAKRFLLADEVTTYRVYLEGRLQGHLSAGMETRSAPFHIALTALAQLKQSFTADSSLRRAILALEHNTHIDPDYLTQAELVQMVKDYHKQLLWLNRQLDPEAR